MKRRADPLQELRERCATTPDIVDWNDIDSLVFREIRETGTLTLSRSCAVVAIQVDTNALSLSDRGTFTGQRDLVTLSWDKSAHVSPHSTLVIQVKEKHSSVAPSIVGVLCNDNFRKLQQFAVMMFKDYRSKVLTLRSSPLSFELLHEDMPSLEKLRDNMHVVSKNLRNLVLEEEHIDVTIELKENDLHARGSELFAVGKQQRETGVYGNIPVTQLAPRRVAGRLPGEHGVRDYSYVKDEASIKAYEEIERKFKLHQENVDARFEEQRRQNEFMRTSLNTIMESLNMSTRLTSSHSDEHDIVGHCSVSLPPVSRVSGDGEEATGELPRTGDTTQIHAFPSGEGQNVSSCQREKRTADSNYDKGLHEQRSKPACENTTDEEKGSEVKHSDSTIRGHIEFEHQNTITLSPANRSTSPKAAPYYEAGARNMFTVPAPSLKTEPEHRASLSRGITTPDGYESTTEGYIEPFIHIVGDDPRANRINTTIRRELNSKQTFPPRAPTSMGTVLCFDTSTSIGHEGLQQMKKKALAFIDGIEDIVQEHDLEENIGVVAFGGISRIEHHLSNDYTSVRDTVERLELSGRSPLFEALTVCLCCIKLRGGIINLSGVVALRPRLIIFTDGNASDESDTGVGDVHCTDVQVKMQIIDLLQHLTTKAIFPKPVVWIPVGKADREFLMFLANKSNGICLEGADIAELCKYQRIQDTISKVFKCISHGIGPETGTTSNQIQTLIGAFGDKFTDEDQREIAKSVTELIEKGVCFPELGINEELAGLPHLGSRVTRLRDYDTEGPGTIVSHIPSRKDWVLVHWDNGQMSECRYGAEGAFDVMVVTDQPRYNSSDMTFDIGCEVTRGPDWEPKYAYQDGGDGGVGVVIGNQQEGLVTVRWLITGHIGVYRCGRGGKIDLILRDPIESLKEATQSDGQMHHGLAAVAEERKPLDDAVPEMDEEDYRWVWQWQDGEGQWRLYSDEETQKLESIFQRPKGSSCLLQRDGKSYRVIFKENLEKNLHDGTMRNVKRTRMNEDDLTVYKEVERQLRRV